MFYNIGPWANFRHVLCSAYFKAFYVSQNFIKMSNIVVTEAKIYNLKYRAKFERNCW
jgi:hypothetical protein